MTISEYACDDCGYAYQGCGGLGVLESGEGRQTVSCATCPALHDVPLGASLWELTRKPERRRGPGRRAPAEPPALESALAALAFACPVDTSHEVRPWTDDEPRMTVSGALVATCPVCEGHVSQVRAIMLLD